jgi:hypothetical protein
MCPFAIISDLDKILDQQPRHPENGAIVLLCYLPFFLICFWYFFGRLAARGVQNSKHFFSAKRPCRKRFTNKWTKIQVFLECFVLSLFRLFLNEGFLNHYKTKLQNIFVENLFAKKTKKCKTIFSRLGGRGVRKHHTQKKLINTCDPATFRPLVHVLWETKHVLKTRRASCQALSR